MSSLLELMQDMKSMADEYVDKSIVLLEEVEDDYEEEDEDDYEEEDEDSEYPFYMSASDIEARELGIGVTWWV